MGAETASGACESARIVRAGGCDLLDDETRLRVHGLEISRLNILKLGLTCGTTPSIWSPENQKPSPWQAFTSYDSQPRATPDAAISAAVTGRMRDMIR